MKLGKKRLLAGALILVIGMGSLPVSSAAEERSLAGSAYSASVGAEITRRADDYKKQLEEAKKKKEEYERKKKDAVSNQPNYITREEFEKRISEITSNRKSNAPQRRERSE